MKRSELIEAMARAINDTGLAWQSDMLDHDALLARASSALSALEARGMVVVPREITNAIADAADATGMGDFGGGNGTPFDAIQELWTAMLSASQEPQT